MCDFILASYYDHIMKTCPWTGTAKVIFIFCAAHLPVKLDIETKFTYFVSISRLPGKCATQKLKNFCFSSLWTCLHHMVILRSQNKIISQACVS